jgi:hypothetical protein
MFQRPSLRGLKIFHLFINGYLGNIWTFFFLLKFKTFKMLIETSEGKPIKVIWGDTGNEVLLKVFNIFCEMHGIWQQLTTTNTPHQNGVT